MYPSPRQGKRPVTFETWNKHTMKHAAELRALRLDSCLKFSCIYMKVRGGTWC